MGVIAAQIAAANAGALPRAVCRLDSGWVVLGDPQVLPGYCVLLADPVVGTLNDLDGERRATYLADMARLGRRGARRHRLRAGELRDPRETSPRSCTPTSSPATPTNRTTCG